MDRLDELEALIAILDSGSLAGAARLLRRSPPALTRTLAALEDRVGIRLVERTTRKLMPTQAGRRLAEQARRLLDDYRTAVTEDADAPLRGLLRVTAPVVFGRRHVAPVVDAYLDRHPAMQVELVLNDRNLDLIEEGLDVAVRIGPLRDTGMTARPVGQVQRLLVASPAYLALRGTPHTLSDLAGHDVIFTSLRAVAPEWRFREGQRERALQLKPRLSINDIEAVLRAAKAGRGVARMLSYQVAEELASGALVRLLPDTEPPPLPVHLVVASTRHMAPRLRSFLDQAVEQLAQIPVLRGI